MKDSSDKCLKIAAKALANGEFDVASSLYSQIAALDSDCVLSRRALARIHTRERQCALAVDRWIEVRIRRPDIRETSLRLGRLYKQLGEIESSLAEYQNYLELEPEHAESLKIIAQLEIELKHAACKDIVMATRHLAIGGVSYSGSTILSRVLGNIAGVENVGESHRLVTRRGSLESAEVDFDLDNDEVISYCFSCGKDCGIFTSDFRRQLQADPTNWYFKIGEELNAEVLLTSDKNYAKLKAKDPYLRMDLLVLFKSPLQAWYSNYKKIGLAEWGTRRISEVDEYLGKWQQSMSRFVEDFENTGKKVFLSFDHFCEAPEFHLERICRLFDLNHELGLLQKKSVAQHSFGGNRDVNNGLENSDKNPTIKRLSEVDLPPEHVSRIEANQEISRLHEQLLSLYSVDFSSLDILEIPDMRL